MRPIRLRSRCLVAVAGAAAVLSALPAAAAASAAGATSTASAQAGPAASPLPGSAIPFTRTATVIGAAPAARRLSIQVWLRPRLAAAQRFAAAVSTPGRPGFGHFLSPDAWTARFGASPGTARAGGGLAADGRLHQRAR